MLPRSLRRAADLALLVGGVAACGSSSGDPFKQDVLSAGGAGGAIGAGGDATSATSSDAATSVSSATGGGGGGNVGGSGGGGQGGGGEPDPWAGPVQHLAVLDLGEQALGTSHAFPVPDRTLGFTVVSRAPATTDVIGVARLRPPAGGSVILDFAMAGHAAQVFGNLGWVAAANPQSDSADAWPVQAGNWRVTLGNDGSELPGANVSIWARRTEDGQFHGGVVDVNVFVAPGVADAAYLDQVLAGLFPFAELDLGQVTYYPLAPEAVVIGSIGEYRELLATSGGIGAAPALNVFVVGDFEDGTFGAAIGVAGGVPGITVSQGTSMSGVAYQPSGDPSYDATVLRHEVGHLGGLFHTTELQIDESDPLSDTPSCNEQIQSNPQACPDAGNTMFPIAYGATSFSSAQLRVIQGSGLYRGATVAGGPPGPALPIAPAPGAPALQPGEPPVVAPWAEDARLPASPSALEAVLGAVWCGESVHHHDLATRAAGRDVEAALLHVVSDRGAAAFVRARALATYARWARSRGPDDASLRRATALAARLARDPGSGRALRVASLRVVSASDGSASGPSQSPGLTPSAAAIVAGLARSNDVVVREVASSSSGRGRGSRLNPSGGTPVTR